MQDEKQQTNEAAAEPAEAQSPKLAAAEAPAPEAPPKLRRPSTRSWPARTSRRRRGRGGDRGRRQSWTA